MSYINLNEMREAIGSAHDKIAKPVKTQPMTVSDNERSMTRSTGLRSAQTPPDLARLSSALAVLDPDCDEREWKFEVLAPLARAARDYPQMAAELKELGRAFSSGVLRGKPSIAWVTQGNRNGLTGEQAFEGQWERFLNEPPSDVNRTGLGTIFHNAEQVKKGSPQEINKNPIAKAVAKENSGPPDLLLDLQERYALIPISGKIFVLDKESLAAMDISGAAKKLVLFNLSDGRLLMKRMARELHPAAFASETIKEFFINPQTTCYDGIEFNPARTTYNHLNLWVGPTVTPTKGEWLLIKAFLFIVICNSNTDQFNYLIRLIAHALQRPWEKPGILVILIGGQGVGKGTLGRILRKIWSATYLQVNRIAAITGEFNAALERAFIVVMDEALFAGDHRASDALKSLVTEEVIHINEKHQPARQIASFHRFFIFTNADHVKSTDRDDRRDFTLRVSDSRKGDHEYWNALDREMQGGGAEAMVHDLLAMDLSEFNVRSKPNTQELVEQKLQSLAPIPRWWHDALDGGAPNGESEWPGKNCTATRAPWT